MHHTKTVLAIVACALLLAGCPKQQIGSTHLSVLAVREFDEGARAELSPNFQLTATKALEKTANDTMALERSLYDSFRMRGGAAISTKEAMPAGFGEGQSGSVTIFNTNTSDFVKGRPALPTDKPDTVAIAENTSHEPFLNYLAATALFQEAKLLQYYVQHAAIGDRKAYIVRLQLTHMPKGRNKVYDTYIDLSFFHEGVAMDSSDIQLKTQPSGSIRMLNPRSKAQIYIDRLHDQKRALEEIQNSIANLKELPAPPYGFPAELLEAAKEDVELLNQRLRVLKQRAWRIQE